MGVRWYLIVVLISISLVKKAELRRIDAFELWCWRRLLRVPWTARSNQSILKETNPEYSLERLMLKLKLQYFGHLMHRADSFEKTLILGKIEGRRRRGWCWERLRAGGEGDNRGWDGWMASPTQWTWVCVASGSWWWTGRPGVLRFMGSQRVGHDWVTELNWTGNLLKAHQRLCYYHGEMREINIYVFFKSDDDDPHKNMCILKQRGSFHCQEWLSSRRLSLGYHIWMAKFYGLLLLFVIKEQASLPFK